MKLKVKFLTLAAFAGLVANVQAAQQYIPNGDFEIADGDSWNSNGSPGTEISFPTEGGNPFGYGKIDNSAGVWGVLVAEGGSGPSPAMGTVPSTGDGISLASLGLTAGETYTFNLDMIDFSGAGPNAGMKIESWAGGPAALSDSGNNTFPTTSSWANYSFDYTINPSATHIKFVPLLVEQGAVAVGFDNVGYNDEPVDLDPPPVGEFIIPNGEFSNGASGWGQFQAGTVDISFPATGGNPVEGGYGAIDFSSGDFAGLVSGTFPLASLGLEAGNTYIFKMDMINLDGAGPVGALKFEFDASATPNNSGDRMPDALVGDGSTWQTYEFTWTVPADATVIRFVPLWGGDGTNIGYDNVGGNNTPVAEPPFEPAQIPNPGFELDPLGVNWTTTETTPNYVDDGMGNPGRFVQLTDGVGAFSVLYAFNGAEVTFASLGLSPGDSYQIQMDMKIITPGTDPTTPIGGIFLNGPAGFSQESWPDLQGDGMDWATYTMDFTVPAVEDPPTPEQFRLGIRPGKPGSGATVAFDNVILVTGPPAEPFIAEIKQGTLIGWEPTNLMNTYQPQSSEDGTVWTDIGPAFVGDSVTSIFAASTAPNYRVEEFENSFVEAALNGSFETANPEDDPFGALSWDTANFLDNPQIPTRIDGPPDGSDAPEGTYVARTGDWMMQLRVENDAAASNNSEMQQNILNAGGEITPGASYDFSFYAKQVSREGSYEQRFRVVWLGASGELGDITFTPIMGGDGVWQENKLTGRVAPAGAVSALIQFIAVTGAVEPTEEVLQKGEVLIDDVSFVESTPMSVGFLMTNTSEGVGICWPSEIGKSYQVKCSTGLSMFEDFGPLLQGSGEIMSVGDVITPPRKFYQVTETP